jgi:hypothetical protein
MAATWLDLRKEALRVALTQDGIIERGGPNRGPEVEKYLAVVGLKGGNPWCAAFVCWCYDRAMKNLKMRRSPPFHFTGSVYKLWTTAPTKWKSDKPTVGAVYCHLTEPHLPGSPGHCGIVVRVEEEFQSFMGVEGNTNAYGSRIGDRVRINRRDFAYANAGFIDIGREGPELPPATALQS